MSTRLPVWTFVALSAWGAAAEDPLATLRERGAALTQEQRAALPATWRPLLALADRAPRNAARREVRRPTAGAQAAAAGPRPLTGGKVNDPSRDYRYSSFVGATQMNSATAWCAPNVVTAYDDTQGLALAFEGLSAGYSLAAYSYSPNNGATFYAGGPLAPGPVDPFVSTDAVTACTDKDTFFIVTAGTGTLGIYKSTDGGRSFGEIGHLAGEDDHGLGSPWLAADPADPAKQTLYLAYSDLLFVDPACPGIAPGVSGPSTGNAITRSTDGGVTWSGAVSLGAHDCGGIGAPAVAVGGDRGIHAAWVEDVGGSQQLTIMRSTDGGATFATAATRAASGVGNVLASGSAMGEWLEGNLGRSPRPQIAIDRSGHVGSDGSVYVAWDVGGTTVPDPGLPSVIGDAVYAYGDVVLMTSTDGGASFGTPLEIAGPPLVIAPPSLLAGRSVDRFGSGIAVDRNGVVGVCWYDRRNDPANFLYDRYCARSTSGGASFVAARKTRVSQPPLAVTDVALDFTLGDFDTVASDFTGTLPGFRSGYTDTSAGQPDVRMSIF